MNVCINAVVNSSTGCVLWYTLYANCDPLTTLFMYVCVCVDVYVLCGWVCGCMYVLANEKNGHGS